MKATKTGFVLSLLFFLVPAFAVIGGSCGQYINSSETLTGDIVDCAGTVLYINASGITLDCDGFLLWTSGSYAIRNDGFDNVVIKNCVINFSAYGIYFNNSDDGTIQNNTLSASPGNDANQGIYVGFGQDNLITENTLTGDEECIYLDASSSNDITYNTISCTDYCIALRAGSNQNTLHHNDASGDYTFTLEASSNNLAYVNDIQGGGYYGVYFTDGSNDNIFDENDIFGSAGGVYLGSSYGNRFIRGWIHGEEGDYWLNNAGSSNVFRLTNFTGQRGIVLSGNSWFNYVNEEEAGVWLNTSIDASRSVNRELFEITRSRVEWNDSGWDLTVTYNISWLYPNEYYDIYNNSVLMQTLQSDGNGVLPSFNVYLPSHGGSRNITVVQSTSSDTIPPIVSLTSPQNTTYPPDSNITLNFTYTEENPGVCLYNLDGAGNVSIDYSNGTFLTSSGGAHSVELWCNDTNGLWGGDSIDFTVSVTSIPSVGLLTPANGLETNDITPLFSYRVSDADNASVNCTLYVDDNAVSFDSSAMADGSTDNNFTVSPLSFDTHSWFVNCSDGNNTGVSPEWSFSIQNETEHSEDNDTVPSNDTNVSAPPSNGGGKKENETVSIPGNGLNETIASPPPNASQGNGASAPACGNGIKDEGEECDGMDGVPKTGGYSCSNECKLEFPSRGSPFFSLGDSSVAVGGLNFNWDLLLLILIGVVILAVVAAMVYFKVTSEKHRL